MAVAVSRLTPSRTVGVLREGVRPVVTYLFAGAFVAGFLLGRIPVETFTPVGIMIFGFWFGERSAKSKSS